MSFTFLEILSKRKIDPEADISNNFNGISLILQEKALLFI